MSRLTPLSGCRSPLRGIVTTASEDGERLFHAMRADLPAGRGIIDPRMSVPVKARSCRSYGDRSYGVTVTVQKLMSPTLD
jgi:hypothetical protein